MKSTDVAPERLISLVYRKSRRLLIIDSPFSSVSRRRIIAVFCTGHCHHWIERSSWMIGDNSWTSEHHHRSRVGEVRVGKGKETRSRFYLKRKRPLRTTRRGQKKRTSSLWHATESGGNEKKREEMERNGRFCFDKPSEQNKKKKREKEKEWKGLRSPITIRC